MSIEVLWSVECAVASKARGQLWIRPKVEIAVSSRTDSMTKPTQARATTRIHAQRFSTSSLIRFVALQTFLPWLTKRGRSGHTQNCRLRWLNWDSTSFGSIPPTKVFYTLPPKLMQRQLSASRLALESSCIMSLRIFLRTCLHGMPGAVSSSLREIGPVLCFVSSSKFARSMSL